MKKTLFLLFVGLFIVISSSSFGQDDKESAQKMKIIKESKKSYNKGIDQIIKKQYQDAIEEMNKAIEMNDKFDLAYLQRGKSKFEIGDNSGALADIEKAITINPDLGEAYFCKAYINYTILRVNKEDSLKNTIEALMTDYDKAISKEYEEAEVYYYRGLAKLVLEQYSDAIADFNNAVEKKENYDNAYHDRGTAKRLLGDYQGAIYDYRKAVDYNPNFAQAYNNLGSVKTITGDFQGAVEYYDIAVNISPSYYIAINNRGRAKYFLGDFEGAIKDFNAVLTLKKDYKYAVNNLANSKIKSNPEELEGPIELYDEAIGYDEAYGIAIMNRGFARETSGDIEGACEDWQKAFELGVPEAEKYANECK